MRLLVGVDDCVVGVKRSVEGHSADVVHDDTVVNSIYTFLLDRVRPCLRIVPYVAEARDVE